jgi:hypothetical protein
MMTVTYDQTRGSSSTDFQSGYCVNSGNTLPSGLTFDSLSGTIQGVVTSAAGFTPGASYTYTITPTHTNYIAAGNPFTFVLVIDNPLTGCAYTPSMIIGPPTIGTTAANPLPYCGYVPGLASGTYYVMQANGSAAQYYCLNTVNGGGWTLIGSAPAANWFSGNTAAAWSNLSYSFGTYSAGGTVGDYWTSIANLANASAYDEVMFITGNRKYFLHVLMSSVSITGSGPITFTPIRTSSNMGSPQTNNFATIFFRSGINEGNRISQ